MTSSRFSFLSRLLKARIWRSLASCLDAGPGRCGSRPYTHDLALCAPVLKLGVVDAFSAQKCANITMGARGGGSRDALLVGRTEPAPAGRTRGNHFHG